MNRVPRVVYRIFLGFFKILIIPTTGRYLQKPALKDSEQSFKIFDAHSRDLQAYCSLRNEMGRNEMEMEICSLRNGNLYFAKWKSVVCEMEICSLRNENL